MSIARGFAVKNSSAAGAYVQPAVHPRVAAQRAGFTELMAVVVDPHPCQNHRENDCRWTHQSLVSITIGLLGEFQSISAPWEVVSNNWPLVM